MRAAYGVTVISVLSAEPAMEAKAAAKSTKTSRTAAALTGWVVIGKVPEVAPAGMVSMAGTEATLGISLWRLSWRPPAGAGWLRFTVPVTTVPPVTSAALSVRVRLIFPEAGGGGAAPGRRLRS